MLPLSPRDTAFILIEYQNEWVSHHGHLRSLLVKDNDQFEDAILASEHALNIARKKGFHVIHVTLKPDPDYKIFGNALYGLRHTIPKVKTWQGEQGLIHKKFAPETNEHVITERTGASAFSGSNLDSYLRNNQIPNLILMGFATHVCIESTLRDAHDLGYNTMVLTEATGAFTQEQKRYFSQNIVHHFGQEVSIQDLIQ